MPLGSLLGDLESFAEALEEFRVVMNERGQIGFQPLSQDSILRIFKAYKARAAAANLSNPNTDVRLQTK